jgi:hexokinase
MKLLFIVSCFCSQLVFAQNKILTVDNIEAEKKEKLEKIRKEILKKKRLFGTKTPLYIINGIVSSSIQSIDTLSVVDIKAILPKTAVKKYGAIGENGILKITKTPSFQRKKLLNE